MLTALTVAAVILDQALDNSLDYQIPEKFLGKIDVGMRVTVPVKNSLRRATVWEIKQSSSCAYLKPIDGILAEKPYISSELCALAHWMAWYYCCPMRKVLKAILPSSIRNTGRAKEQLFVKS